jgi:predicted nucleic acid-binding Zn ribbon protein
MVKIGDLVSAFMGPGAVEKAQVFHSLFTGWAELAGPSLAAHSRIVQLENGVLLVEADHPGWIQTLQLKQGKLLKAARSKFPQLDIRAISFKLSPPAKKP